MDNYLEASAGNMALQRALEGLSDSNLPSTFGNVYFVIPSTYANYVEIFNKYQKVYLDGTFMIYPTIQTAMAACTSNRGDYIYVAPGYVGGAGIVMNKIGMTIIGLGNGLNRPTITYGSAAMTYQVTAANVTLKNFHHIANFADVAAAYTVNAKDFQLENCTFDDNASNLNFKSIVITGSTDNEADGLKVLNNNFRGLATSPDAFISILAAEKRVRIEDNRVFMAATNDVGHFLTLSSKIMTVINVSRNRLIVVGATTATVGIFLTGSGSTSTGIVENNYVASLDTTSELIATAGTGMAFFNNYYTGTADASGKLWPVVDAA